MIEMGLRNFRNAPNGELAMLRTFTPAIRHFGSRFALAIALAAGGLIGSVALASPAMAKEKEEGKAKPKKEANSNGFSKAYKPLQAIINDPAADSTAARALIPVAVAAIENDLDKNVMGSALIALGGRLKDVPLQRQGIEMSLESGKTAPAQLGLYHYYLGKWSFDDQNYAEARRHYQLAYDNGYTEGEPDVLIADTYFRENNNVEGLNYLAGVLGNRRQAGIKVPDGWVLRGLKVAYDAKLVDQANSYAGILINNNPTPENWDNAMSVFIVLNALDAQSLLDLMRLMRLTGTLKARSQYAEYVETAAQSGLPNEVLTVLEEGVAEDIFSANDEYYLEARTIATEKARDDGKQPLPTVDQARAKTTWQVAYGTANAHYSSGNFAEAETMYQIALEKGVTESQLAIERLGMAQVQQGKFAQGKATLAQVTGERAPVAQLWIVYAGIKEAAGG